MEGLAKFASLRPELAKAKSLRDVLSGDAGIHGAAAFFTSGNDLKNLAQRFRRDGFNGWPKSYQVVVPCRASDDSQLRSYLYETHEVLIK